MLLYVFYAVLMLRYSYTVRWICREKELVALQYFLTKIHWSYSTCKYNSKKYQTLASGGDSAIQLMATARRSEEKGGLKNTCIWMDYDYPYLISQKTAIFRFGPTYQQYTRTRHWALGRWLGTTLVHVTRN